MTLLSSYGYDYSKHSMHQLRRVLGLENDQVRFDTIKRDLKTMVIKYLDQTKSSREQGPTVERLLGKLKVKYPELFGGKDSGRNIFYASKVLRWMHCYERKTEKRKRRLAWQAAIACPTTDGTEAPVSPQPRQEDASSPPDPTRSIQAGTSSRRSATAASRPLELEGPTQSSCSGAEKLSREKERLPVTTSMPEAEFGRRNRLSLPPTPVSVQRVRRNGEGNNNPSESAQQSLQERRALNAPSFTSVRGNLNIKPIVSRGQFDRPPEPPSISRGRPNESISLPSRLYTESGVKSVHKFLLSCNPPMDHFLSRFVNFGWRNTNFLYALSAWSDSYRNQMLRKALAHETNGRDPTEAEIAVLDYHLIRYGFVGKENMEV